ncbi:MAG: SDR family NAD(P)-dependent oxidoreductase [Alphaproteobacteria bacterium]|nr:SDR family NAD(P)-dependent oxidoreductase [Alphaproteobacteria bacterium]
MTQQTLRNKRVLVTGADGFIGSHLVERLQRDGASVTALSAYNSFGSAGWLDSLAEGVRRAIEIRAGDIRDPNFVRDLVAGQEVVFHLAALIAIPFSYVAPQSYVDVNVTGTLNVLEACRMHSVQRLVHTSTSETYGTAQYTPIDELHPMQGQSPYSASKIGADHMAEAYWRSFNLPVVILRPFNTFGPRQSERAVIPTVIRQMLDPGCDTIRIGDISPVRDFNFVGDIADAFHTVGTSEKVEYGTVYNAGSGHGVTIGETIEILRGITGCNKPLQEEVDRKRPKNSEVFELIAKAERIGALGWRPAVGLEAGLEKTVAFWRREIGEGRIRQSSDYLV